MLLSVLIPNYNGKELLKKNIPSIQAALEYAGVSHEIIIVDDCSTDNSTDFLQKKYPEIVVLKNDVNLGFSKTCNFGIAQSRGKYLLLLNTDIELTPTYIQKCLSHFTNDNIFAVTGIAIDDSAHPQTTGILYHKGFFAIKKYENHNDNETHFVSGANSMYETAKLKQLNGFNPIFSPYYFEDDDLSYRAMLKNWKSYFIKDAVCFHQGSASIKSAACKRKIKRTYFRNKMIFNRLHSGASTSIFNNKLLALEIFPKVCLGKIWILGSYYQYKKLVIKGN
jgi:GT2 family glycosyltransferase